MARLDQADVLDKLSDASRGLVEYLVTPGAAFAGLVTPYRPLRPAPGGDGDRRGRPRPAGGAVVAAAALVARFGGRGSLSRWSVIIGRPSPARRKAGRAGQQQGGVTVLLSHRFSTVLMADRIAVPERGRPAESGTHRDLVAASGLYAELFALQARAYA